MLGRTLLLRLKTPSPHLGGITGPHSVRPWFGAKRFDDDNDLKDAVQKWLTLQAATFYEEGIQKLVPRYDNCLSNGGEYVEK